MMPTQDINYTTDNDLVIGVDAKTSNAFECSVDGTKLDKAARLLARAYATNAGLSLTLKLPAGIEDK